MEPLEPCDPLETGLLPGGRRLKRDLLSDIIDAAMFLRLIDDIIYKKV